MYSLFYYSNCLASNFALSKLFLDFERFYIESFPNLGVFIFIEFNELL